MCVCARARARVRARACVCVCVCAFRRSQLCMPSAGANVEPTLCSARTLSFFSLFYQRNSLVMRKKRRQHRSLCRYCPRCRTAFPCAMTREERFRTMSSSLWLRNFKSLLAALEKNRSVEWILREWHHRALLLVTSNNQCCSQY